MPEVRVWRLTAHHDVVLAPKAIEQSLKLCRIALGWGRFIRDLRELKPADDQEITALLKPHKEGLGRKRVDDGGRCLWRLYREMREGDLVILSRGGHGEKPVKRFTHVLEVVGPYLFDARPNPALESRERGITDDYFHQRAARCVEDIDPHQLWTHLGAAEGLAGTQDPLLPFRNTYAFHRPR